MRVSGALVDGHMMVDTRMTPGASECVISALLAKLPSAAYHDFSHSAVVFVEGKIKEFQQPLNLAWHMF